MQASVGVVQSVPTQQLSPFYLLSTRDVSRVISFTRPSSHLTFSGKGSTVREDGLGTRQGGSDMITCRSFLLSQQLFSP